MMTSKMPLRLQRRSPSVISLSPLLGDVILTKIESGDVMPRSTDDMISEQSIGRIGLFFGASWCAPAVSMMHKLVDWYVEVRTSGNAVEIIYVSDDEGQSAFDEIYMEMPWTAIPFSEKSTRRALTQRFEISGIPELIFIDSNGRIIADGNLAADIVESDPRGDKLMSLSSSAPVDDLLRHGVVMPSQRAERAMPGGMRTIHEMRVQDIQSSSSSSSSLSSSPPQRTKTRTKTRTETSTVPSVWTLLKSSVPAGSTSLPVRHKDLARRGFRVGQIVRIGDGRLAEERVISAFGSIIIDRPLSYSHSLGEPIAVVSEEDLRVDRRKLRDPEIRKQLLEQKQKRPNISPRKLAQYVLWIDSLQVWPKPVEDLFREMRTGLLLCNMVQKLIPGLRMKGLNPRPRTMRPAVNNIEKALTVIWQEGQPNSRRMPSAAEVFEGKSERISWLVAEVFECFVMRDLRSPGRIRPMMRWYAEVLQHYDITLDPEVMRPPYKGAAYGQNLWQCFRDGVALACVLHFFCGQTGTSMLPSFNIKRIWSNPIAVRQCMDNAEYVLETLREMQIPIVWTVDNFVNFPDTDFMLWQLSSVFVALRGRTSGLRLLKAGEGPRRGEEALARHGAAGVSAVNVNFRETVDNFVDTGSAGIVSGSPGSQHRSTKGTGVPPWDTSPPHIDRQNRALYMQPGDEPRRTSPTMKTLQRGGSPRRTSPPAMERPQTFVVKPMVSPVKGIPPAAIFLVAAQWTMNNVKVFEFQERWMASSEAVTVDNFVNRGDVETAIVLGHDHKHENGRTTLNARVDAVARIGAGLKTIIMSGGMGEAEAMKERLENNPYFRHLSEKPQIILENESYSTRTNAMYSLSVLPSMRDGTSILIVTSAYHARRSLATFQKAAEDQPGTISFQVLGSENAGVVQQELLRELLATAYYIAFRFIEPW
eukprot:g941.t1